MKQIRLDGDFEVTIAENALDNMELIDALVELDGGNPLAVSSTCALLFGKEQRQRLYNHLRAEDGRVPVAAVMKALTDTLTGFGQTGKN